MILPLLLLLSFVQARHDTEKSFEETSREDVSKISELDEIDDLAEFHSSDDDTPAFLRHSSPAAVLEYERLIRNESATPREIEVALNAWATRQDGLVLSEYELWANREANRTAFEEAVKENITLVLNRLPDVYKQLLRILDDETLTIAQRNNQTRHFYASLDWQVAKALNHVIDALDDDDPFKR